MPADGSFQLPSIDLWTSSVQSIMFIKQVMITLWLQLASRIGACWCNRSADQVRHGVKARRSRLTSFPPESLTKPQFEDKNDDSKACPISGRKGLPRVPGNTAGTQHTVLACVGRNACCMVMQPCALLGGWRTLGIKACRMALVNHHQSMGPSK